MESKLTSLIHFVQYTIIDISDTLYYIIIYIQGHKHQLNRLDGSQNFKNNCKQLGKVRTDLWSQIKVTGSKQQVCFFHGKYTHAKLQLNNIFYHINSVTQRVNDHFAICYHYYYNHNNSKLYYDPFKTVCIISKHTLQLIQFITPTENNV